jgi:hypothetical protein
MPDDLPPPASADDIPQPREPASARPTAALDAANQSIADEQGQDPARQPTPAPPGDATTASTAVTHVGSQPDGGDTAQSAQSDPLIHDTPFSAGETAGAAPDPPTSNVAQTPVHTEGRRHLARWESVAVIVTAVIAAGALGVQLWSQLSPNPPVVITPTLPRVEGATGQANPIVNDRCADSPDNVAGWGPDRPMVGGQTFLQWPAFNSDRGGQAGDERNMVGGRESGSTSQWQNTVRVEHGKKYRLRIIIHNSAADLDETVATDTRVRMPLPSCKGKRISINGFIHSVDAFPIEVWGGVNLVADTPFRISYVHDSAILESNGFGPNGKLISGTDFLGDPGQLVGYSQLDGVVRGNYERSMYFSLEVQVSMD